MKLKLSLTLLSLGSTSNCIPTVEGFVVKTTGIHAGSTHNYHSAKDLVSLYSVAESAIDNDASTEMNQRSLLTARLQMETAQRAVAKDDDHVDADVNVETASVDHVNSIDPVEDDQGEKEMLSMDDVESRRRKVKESLFAALGSKPRNQNAGFKDPILADPETKESLVISTEGALIGGQSQSSLKVLLKSSQSTYQGRPNTYYDLLADSSLENASASAMHDNNGSSMDEDEDASENTNTVTDFINSFRVFIPPPVRNILATTGVLPGDDYIPMRDLFTSPQVSFAYERGWRQGFAAAGFPGADKEYEMVKEYFQPLNPDTVVDMSCATGLFTRRLAKGGDYGRVLGCDYSESMLTEARRRIEADADLQNGKGSTELDLVRCDVGNIPMGTETVPALHAGAAMHCWPDLDAALSEVHRVLKPGGRFFASTFLSAYFATVQAAEAGGNNDINSQAFQYFESVDMLRNLLLKAGFEDDKVDIEVLGAACVIIRAEK